MPRRRSRDLLLSIVMLTLSAISPALSPAADPAAPSTRLPAGFVLEERPKDPNAKKIVLIAGSSTFKPGEHEYIGGCAVLLDLLKQTPGVAPVLAIDWPKDPETLAGAKSVVVLFDGADKHGLLKEDRATQWRKLADTGVGLVGLHQFVDFPKDLAERGRDQMGANWEKGLSQRAHWVAEFNKFPDHPIFRGVTPFKIDDGWLFKLHFVADLKGTTPLLRTVSPKMPVPVKEGSEDVIAWSFERPTGGRSFVFTGCHLHASFAEEGYRRFLTNGILWTANVDIPSSGAPVSLKTDELAKYLPPPPPAAATNTKK